MYNDSNIMIVIRVMITIITAPQYNIASAIDSGVRLYQTVYYYYYYNASCVCVCVCVHRCEYVHYAH